MIVASCGHELKEYEGQGIDISIKELDNKGGRCISFICVCTDCYYRYLDYKLILHTKQDETDWLNGKLKYIE